MIQDKTFTYEVDLQPDEKLTLPDSLIEQINAGRWKITFQPVCPTDESETMQPNGNGVPTDTNDNGSPMTDSLARSPREMIAELAAKQGVKPVTDISELRGDFWDPDESVDTFIATIRQWRKE